MKPASTPLKTFLNEVMASPDAPIAFADLFEVELLQTNTVLRFTNTDRDVVWSGNTYSAQGPLVQGLKMNQTRGLNVDRQQITIAARPDFLVNGAAIMASIADGAWDGAYFYRYRVFMASLNDSPIGGVNMFSGRVSTVDQVGRTAAKITVASKLVILDMDMPKNLWSPTCIHVLYDAASYTVSITAGSGSTQNVIASAAANTNYLQGYIIGVTGANAGIRGTIKQVNPGVNFHMAYPFPEVVTVGDTFTATQGCAHTQANCQNQFDNLINFRAFPFVPPPQMAF